MPESLNPIRNEKELTQLQDGFFKNKISRQNRERLFEYYRQQLPGMEDAEITLMLLSSHPDYGKPDENGEIRTI